MAFEKEEKIIEEQLKAGVIRERSIPCASPLVYVRKKDGGTRPCVDYRKLNQLTTIDAYNLPNMNDCLDALGGATLFSCLDLQSGYWQIEKEEKNEEKLLSCAGRVYMSIIPCLLDYVGPLRRFNAVWN